MYLEASSRWRHWEAWATLLSTLESKATPLISTSVGVESTMLQSIISNLHLEIHILSCLEPERRQAWCTEGFLFLMTPDYTIEKAKQRLTENDFTGLLKKSTWTEIHDRHANDHSPQPSFSASGTPIFANPLKHYKRCSSRLSQRILWMTKGRIYTPI